LVLAAGAMASLKQIKENAESSNSTITGEISQQIDDEPALDAELLPEESTSG
jgi:hypothetical protein